MQFMHCLFKYAVVNLNKLCPVARCVQIKTNYYPCLKLRVVKDHKFFYLDQRSRSLQQRSRSLHKRSWLLWWRSRSLLKDQDHWQWSRSILRSRSRSLFDQKFRKRQHITNVYFDNFDRRCNSKIRCSRDLVLYLFLVLGHNNIKKANLLKHYNSF